MKGYSGESFVIAMLNTSQRKLSTISLIADALLLVTAYIVSYYLRFTVFANAGVLGLPDGAQFYSLRGYLKYLIFVLIGYLLIYSACGLYAAKRNRKLEYWNLFEANGLGMLFFSFLLLVFNEGDISRLFLGIFFFLTLLFEVCFRFVFYAILSAYRKKGKNLIHIVIVGYSAAARGYIDRIKANPQWGYYIHGIISDAKEIGFAYRGISVIGTINNLETILADNSFEEVIIALPINDYYKLRRVAGICEKSGAHTKFVPDYNHIIPTIPVMEDFFGLPVINIRNVPLANWGNRMLKRILDIIFSIFGLILFAIPMGIIALLIRITTHGKVIYSQERVGLHNKPFRMYKFCSMKEAKDGEDENEWSSEDNARVTKIGKIIRHTSLDELPQLWNVLRGDMSLIGPRPERPFFVEKFKEEIPRYMIKHQVRPGITGWAQVHGLRGDTSVSRRIDYDLYYIENWTLFLDIRIAFWTVFTGFVNKNAY